MRESRRIKREGKHKLVVVGFFLAGSFWAIIFSEWRIFRFIDSQYASAKTNSRDIPSTLLHKVQVQPVEEHRVWTRGSNDFQPSYVNASTPRTNETTLGYWRQEFYSGYRNQIMGVIALAMWAKKKGHSQLLLETLNHKDTFGSNRFLPFDYLFDVPHWNSHNQLPRLVHCSAMKNYHCNFSIWKCNGQMESCRDPFALGKQTTQLFSNYMRYAKGRGPLAVNGGRNPIDITIMQGALRPKAQIRQLTQDFLFQKTRGEPYFTLHARVEPDMQKHPMCSHLKVTNLTQIIIWFEQEFFENPPAKYLFLPINRASLEAEAEGHKTTNHLAVENLQTLNRIVRSGLWNGQVLAFELGSGILQNTSYTSTPSIIGAMLNFEVAVGSTVFVGTPVSSWSVDVVASRFFRNLTLNYNYLPEKRIARWTHDTDSLPPYFQC